MRRICCLNLLWMRGSEAGLLGLRWLRALCTVKCAVSTLQWRNGWEGRPRAAAFARLQSLLRLSLPPSCPSGRDGRDGWHGDDAAAALALLSKHDRALLMVTSALSVAQTVSCFLSQPLMPCGFLGRLAFCRRSGLGSRVWRTLVHSLFSVVSRRSASSSLLAVSSLSLPPSLPLSLSLPPLSPVLSRRLTDVAAAEDDRLRQRQALGGGIGQLGRGEAALHVHVVAAEERARRRLQPLALRAQLRREGVQQPHRPHRPRPAAHVPARAPLCLALCVCVCVCVCEREREGVCVCVCACVGDFAH